MSDEKSAGSRVRRSVNGAAAAAVVLAVALAATRCSGPNTVTPTPPPPPVAQTAVLIGTGDVADCEHDRGQHAEDTAKLIEASPEAIVFVAGDLAYQDGSRERFENCYGPRWGRFKGRTRPAPGNHEYQSAGAIPYYSYFGPNAGPVGAGFYSYNAGSWHVIALNSNVAATQGSEQYQWLRDDLASTNARCTVAYWHHPRFTSGPSGGIRVDPSLMRDVWSLLIAFNVDVVLNGHDHFYQRFAPQDTDGNANANGIREFVIGTGGAPLYATAGPARNIEFGPLSTYGVLRLTLRSGAYDWEFLEAGRPAPLDIGSGQCH